MERGRRKTAVGVVSSDRMDKTITVKITRFIQHPRYKKYYRKTSKIKAHDERNEAKVGDTVEIMECRRLSKTKSWRLVRILKQAEIR
ncbi:MAG: 30S ribosomal protein S17 [Planctomycetota bacterium]|nr:MAG: 30S ribosomal protein S17 [Planctomycetota bacterium]